MVTVVEGENIKSKCTACSACAFICPKHAICLQQDDEGFYYPILDEKVCISCGKCKKICPALKEKTSIKAQSTYIGCSISDDIRAYGSSGGIFPEIARYICDNNGTAFGVAFDREKQQAIYTGCKTDQLEKLYRSKYVEAKDNDTFLQVKKLLENGSSVLYCGTPCKIDGLLSFLENDYDNLYTIDFMCHGKPSAGFLSDVIRDEEKKADDICTNVTFREKLNGWRKQTTAFYFSRNNAVKYDSSLYFYYYYFLHNYTIRKSCIGCKYYKSHMADITLSDYWQIPKEKDDDKGTSLIQINTEKGKELLNRIRNKTDIQQITNLSNMELYAHTSRKGYKMKKRDTFFRIYKEELHISGTKDLKKSKERTSGDRNASQNLLQ